MVGLVDRSLIMVGKYAEQLFPACVEEEEAVDLSTDISAAIQQYVTVGA